MALSSGAPEGVLLPGEVYSPPVLIGMKIDPRQPLNFDFILDPGEGALSPEDLRKESDRLIRYFLASLAIPEDELWVNLSPHEPERIISEEFSRTRMGMDLLAQDYLLKQMTSSLLYPESDPGRRFWESVYQKAYERYGTTDVPMDVFNRVWIVPETAGVETRDQMVMITRSRLKVMLEADYWKARGDQRDSVRSEGAGITAEKQTVAVDRQVSLSDMQAEILREIIVPEIEREVNEGAHFAALRQIYHSFILAVWYKSNLKDSLLGRGYADRRNVNGIDSEEKGGRRRIYEQYLRALEEGAYSYIREEYDPARGAVVPRHYFSGGVALKAEVEESPADFAMLSGSGKELMTVSGKFYQKGGRADSDLKSARAPEPEPQGAAWWEPLESLSEEDRRDPDKVREAIFGEGVDEWLALQNKKGDSGILQAAVQTLLADVDFKRVIMNSQKNDVFLNMIKFLVKNQRKVYLGTRQFKSLILALKQNADHEFKKMIPVIKVSLTCYVEFITNLGVVQTDLDSQFLNIFEYDRLAELIDMMTSKKLELSLRADYVLDNIFYMLPERVSRHVFRRDFRLVNLAKSDYKNLRQGLQLAQVQEYLDKDFLNENKVPKKYRLFFLIKILKAQGVVLKARNAGKIYSGIPYKIAPHVTRDDIPVFQLLDLPYGELETAIKALSDHRVLAYLERSSRVLLDEDSRIVYKKVLARDFLNEIIRYGYDLGISVKKFYDLLSEDMKKSVFLEGDSYEIDEKGTMKIRFFDAYTIRYDFLKLPEFDQIRNQSIVPLWNKEFDDVVAFQVDTGSGGKKIITAEDVVVKEQFKISPIGSSWHEGLKGLSYQHIKEKIFGADINNWLARHSGQGDPAVVNRVVRHLLSHPEFCSLIQKADKNDIALEIVHFAVENKIYFGARNFGMVLDELRKGFANLPEFEIPENWISFSVFVKIISGLGVIQDKKDFQEIQNIPRNTRFFKIMEMLKIFYNDQPVPLDGTARGNMLGGWRHSYSSLPSRIGQNVKKQDIAVAIQRLTVEEHEKTARFLKSQEMNGFFERYRNKRLKARLNLDNLIRYVRQRTGLDFDINRMLFFFLLPEDVRPFVDRSGREYRVGGNGTLSARDMGIKGDSIYNFRYYRDDLKFWQGRKVIPLLNRSGKISAFELEGENPDEFFTIQAFGVLEKSSDADWTEDMAEMRKKIFGPGIDAWLMLHNKSGNINALNDAARYLSSQPEFIKIIETSSPDEILFEIIRFAVRQWDENKQEIRFGTKNFSTFLKVLRQHLAPDLLQRIPKVSESNASIETFVGRAAILSAIQKRVFNAAKGSNDTSLRQKIFGDGIDRWLSINDASVSPRNLKSAVEFCCSNEAFVNILRDNQKKDILFEVLRFMVKNERPAGTRDLNLFLRQLRRSLDSELRDKILPFPMFFQFRTFVDMIADLRVPPAYFFEQKFDELWELFEKNFNDKDVGNHEGIIWFEDLEGLSFEDARRKIFGSGIDRWTQQHVQYGNPQKVESAVSWCLENEYFTRMLKFGKKNDVPLEVVRFFAANNVMLGTKSMRLFLQELSERAQADLSKNIPFLYSFVSSFVDVISALGVSQPFLSEEFLADDFLKADRLFKISDFVEDPLIQNGFKNKVSLRVLHSVLPYWISRRVSRKQIPFAILDHKRKEALRDILKESHIQKFLEPRFLTQFPETWRLGELILKAQELGFDIGNGRLRDLFYSLPNKLSPHVSRSDMSSLMITLDEYKAFRRVWDSAAIQAYFQNFGKEQAQRKWSLDELSHKFQEAGLGIPIDPLKLFALIPKEFQWIIEKGRDEYAVSPDGMVAIGRYRWNLNHALPGGTGQSKYYAVPLWNHASSIVSVEVFQDGESLGVFPVNGDMVSGAIENGKTVLDRDERTFVQEGRSVHDEVYTVQLLEILYSGIADFLNRSDRDRQDSFDLESEAEKYFEVLFQLFELNGSSGLKPQDVVVSAIEAAGGEVNVRDVLEFLRYLLSPEALGRGIRLDEIVSEEMTEYLTHREDVLSAEGLADTGFESGRPADNATGGIDFYSGFFEIESGEGSANLAAPLDGFRTPEPAVIESLVPVIFTITPFSTLPGALSSEKDREGTVRFSMAES